MIIILLDHVGYFLVSPFGDTETLYWLLRGIGRLGFPLYAFFIVEGIIHSRNIKNYLLKILALALVISTFQVLSLILHSVSTSTSARLTMCFSHSSLEA